MTKPRGGAADRAHAWIREAILSGRLAPGDMLSENELASGLAMSRTPVRAALTRLQDEGLVRIYPQRGALVRELSDHEVREAAEVRHALETAGVQLAVPDRRGRLAEALGDNLERQERALDEQDFPAFASLAQRFHRAFVEQAGNSVMLEVYDRLQDRQSLSIIRSADRITHQPHAVLEEHRTLLQDAGQGDWSAFATHLRDHQTASHGV